jgi:hypothetical protein
LQKNIFLPSDSICKKNSRESWGEMKNYTENTFISMLHIERAGAAAFNTQAESGSMDMKSK